MSRTAYRRRPVSRAHFRIHKKDVVLATRTTLSPIAKGGAVSAGGVAGNAEREGGGGVLETEEARGLLEAAQESGQLTTEEIEL